MKRYFIVNEFFGIRVYDSKEKKELYYHCDESKNIKKELEGQYTYIDNKREKTFSAPLKISMNLTKKCNLRCIQCFSNSGVYSKNELTTKQMYKLFDDMLKNGTFYICLGGGEPFTREDLFEILEYGKQKQLAISIVTNSLLLTKDKLLKLNHMDLDYLWVSLEGLKENHDKLRGEGTFDKTIKKLKLIKKYYTGKTALRMSINKFNIDEMQDLVNIASRNNFDLIRFTPLLSFGRAKDKDLVIDREQYIKFFENIKNLETNNVQVIYPNMENNKIWVGQNGFGCHCGKEAIWIDEIGDVSPCIFWSDDYTVGNIKSLSYIDLWNRCLEISDISGNEICKSCNDYKVCRGGCRARALFENGNLDEIDPLCPKKRSLIKK